LFLLILMERKSTWRVCAEIFVEYTRKKGRRQKFFEKKDAILDLALCNRSREIDDALRERLQKIIVG